MINDCVLLVYYSRAKPFQGETRTLNIEISKNYQYMIRGQFKFRIPKFVFHERKSKKHINCHIHHEIISQPLYE